MASQEKIREDKAEEIINAAQRRFGIYGVEKTTMKEIANDLKLSKASLYYYFPDKENLYSVVIRKEQKEFMEMLEKEINKTPDPAECLMLYALARLSYFRKLLNLSRIRLASFSEMKPKIANSMLDFREEEKRFIARVMERGNASGHFKIEETGKTASLFLDLLKGLRSTFITDKDLLVIDDSEYKELSEKVKEITGVFIKGLMYK